MNESLTYYIGTFIIAIFIIYLLIIFSNRQNNVIEGIANNNNNNTNLNFMIKDINKKIENENTKLEDTLLLNKYKTDYEDLIINLDKKYTLSILLDLILLSDMKNQNQEIIKSSISNINSKFQLKDNLNVLLASLEDLHKDNNKSSLF